MRNQGEVGELYWFALRTLPQREDMAAKVLRHDGLVAVIKTERRLRRRTKWDKERKYITYNASPGYVFIATPAGKDPREFVRPLHIFRSFVSKDGAPLRLPTQSAEVKARDGSTYMRHGILQFLEIEAGELPGYYRHFKTGREFTIGQTVIINTGPFRDHQVRVEDIQNGEAMFFMRLLGREQTVRVSVDDCIPVEKAA